MRCSRSTWPPRSDFPTRRMTMKKLLLCAVLTAFALAAQATDRSYPNVYIKGAGAGLVIQNGGTVTLEPGATGGMVSNGVSATDDVTAVTSAGAYTAHAQTVTIPAST